MCMNQGLTQSLCERLATNYSNGRTQVGVFPCYDTWGATQQSFARDIAAREAARMWGFNPPNADQIRKESIELIDLLSRDEGGVYCKKPCGEQWNWPALACFCNWFFWLNDAARAQVKSDIASQDWPTWAFWAMHFQQSCPNEVRNDPTYGTTYASSPQASALPPAWDRKGIASSEPLGPTPHPWPLLSLGEGSTALPGMPPPCEPFPQCVTEVLGFGLPAPCEPFPQCAVDAARALAATNPALAVTMDAQGRGDYQSAGAQARGAKEKSSVLPWVVAGAAGALALGAIVYVARKPKPPAPRAAFEVGEGKRPSSSEVDALVLTLARYMEAENAPMRVQQRLHAAYLRQLASLERKYPGVDFRSDAASTTVADLAKAKMRAFRGPGCSYEVGESVRERIPNELPDLLRKWFGPDAGQPGVPLHYVMFRRQGGRWEARPDQGGKLAVPCASQGDTFFAQVRVNQASGKPILFPLPQRSACPQIPAADTRVAVEGKPWIFGFRKIAINTARRA